MKTRIRATAVLGLPAVVGRCLLLDPAIAAASVVSPLPESDYTVRPVCAAPAPGYAGCLALELVPKTAAARAHTHPLGITSEPADRGGAKASEGAFGLRPQDLHSIYALPTTAASTQTIALVDAYNDLSAEADLKVYDEEFGLPACTAANGCFEQVNQKGRTQSRKTALPREHRSKSKRRSDCKTGPREAREAACKEVEEADGWAEEMSLDIEVSHATCQSCKIMLVEANSASFEDLEEAEQTAASARRHRDLELLGRPRAGRDAEGRHASPFNHPGTVITASAGDDGYLDWDAEARAERASPTIPPPPHTWSRSAAPACWARSAPVERGRARRCGTGDGAGGGAAAVLRSPLRPGSRAPPTGNRSDAANIAPSPMSPPTPTPIRGSRVRLHRGMRIRRRRRTCTWPIGARSAAPASPRR